MSSEHLVDQSRSGQLDRRSLVRSLAALAAPVIGGSLLANAALAGGKRSKKHRKSGRGGAGAECNGGCK
jgi:hypothetical protein